MFEQFVHGAVKLGKSIKVGWALVLAEGDLDAGHWKAARKRLVSLETNNPEKDRLLARTYLLEADEAISARQVERAWHLYQQAHACDPSGLREPLLALSLKLAEREVTTGEAATLLERAVARLAQSASLLPHDEFRRLKVHAGYVFAINRLSGGHCDEAIRFALDHYYYQAHMARRARRFHQIGPYASRILRMDPTQVRAMDLMAEAEYRIGRLHEAIRWTREQVARAATAESAFKCAWLLARANQYENAVTLLDQFPLSSYTSPTRVLELKAFCLWQRGHVTEAQRVCRDDQAPPALRALAKVMDIVQNLEPTDDGACATEDPIVLFALALLEDWKGNYRQAADLLARVPSGRWLERATVLRALCLADAGQLAEAQEVLQAPEAASDPRANLLRGLVEVRSSRYDKAVAAWRAASNQQLSLPAGWTDGAAFLDLLERCRAGSPASVLAEVRQRDWPADLLSPVQKLQATAAWRLVVSATRSGRVEEAQQALSWIGPLADTPEGRVVTRFLAVAQGEAEDRIFETRSYRAHHQFISAQYALRRGELDECEQLLRELEGVPAFSPGVGHLRAQRSLLSGDLPQAVTEAERAGVAAVWLVGCQVFLGQRKVTSHEALELAPTAPGWARVWRTADPESANRLLQQFAQGAKAPAEWKRLWAAVQLREVLDAVEQGELPEGPLQDLIHDGGDAQTRSEALNLMGVNALRLGDPRRARRFFEQVTPTTSDGKRNAQINLCISLAADNLPEDAAGAWDRLLEDLVSDLDSDDAVAQQRVLCAARRTAALARSVEAWEIAHRAATRGLEVDGTDLMLATAGYEALLRLKRRDEATNLIDRVLARLDDPMPLLCHQVEIDWLVGESEVAVDRLYKLIVRAPGNLQVQRLSYLIKQALLGNLSMLEEQRGHLDPSGIRSVVNILTLLLKLENDPDVSAALLRQRAYYWLLWAERTRDSDGVIRARLDVAEALDLVDDPEEVEKLRHLSAVLDALEG